MRTTLAVVCAVGLALAALCAHADTDPRLSSKVSGSFGCLPLDELLPKLGHSAGVRLEATGVARDMLGFVCVKDRSLGEVMKRIAQTFDLTWSRSGDEDKPVYTLSQTVTQRLKIEKERRDARHVNVLKAVNAVKKALAERRRVAALPESERKRLVGELEQLRKEPAGDDEQRKEPTAEQEFGEDLQQPDAALALELESRLSDAEWQRLFETGSLVCSTYPSPSEAALPPIALTNCGPWMKWLVDEQARQKQFWQNARGMSMWPARTTVFGRDGFSPEDAVELRLTLKSDEKDLETSAPFWVESAVALLDREGSTLAASNQDTMYLRDYIEGGPDESIDPWLGRPYRPPERLRKLAYDREKMSAEYHALSAASIVDPLDVLAVPLLDDVADKMRVPVVAALSDAAVGCYLADTAEPLWLILSNVGGASTDFKYESGWLLGPLSRNRRLNGDHSCPRWLLRKIVGELRAERIPSVDLMAEASHELGDAGMQLLWLTMNRIWPEFDCPSFGTPILEFWASSSPQQRSVFLRGGTVPIDRLTPSQVAIIMAKLHGSSRQIPLVPESPPQLLADDAACSVIVATGFPGYLQQDVTGETVYSDGTRIDSYSYSPLEDASDAYGYASSQRGGIVRGLSWKLKLVVRFQGHNTMSSDATATYQLSDKALRLEDAPADLRRFLESGKQKYEERERKMNEVFHREQLHE